MAAPLKLLIGPLVFKRPQPPLFSLSGWFPLDHTRYIHHLVFACRTTHADRAECTAGDATSYLDPYLCNEHCSPQLKPFLSFNNPPYSFPHVTWNPASHKKTLPRLCLALLFLVILIIFGNVLFPAVNLIC